MAGVLVVDDEELIRSSLVRVLQVRGHDDVEATTASTSLNGSRLASLRPRRRAVGASSLFRCPSSTSFGSHLSQAPPSYFVFSSGSSGQRRLVRLFVGPADL
jgi:hypothetical protein